MSEASLGTFHLVDHTADVGVEATGRTFAEALGWISKGMFSVITDLGTVQPRESITVSVVSDDIDALVVDWLNELLYRHESDGFLAVEFRLTFDRKAVLVTGQCIGEQVDSERHTTRTAVKAATYHQLEVSSNGEWRIRVVLDV